MSQEIDQNLRKVIKPGDEAVRSATGKGWQEWFKILDQAGAQGLDHKSIVAYLNDHFSISSWWQQQVTVTYEQVRGLRKVHEMPDGYQISRSKTIGVPISKLYSAWIEPDLQEAWLGKVDLQIRSVNLNKSLRFSWLEPLSLVTVNFYGKTGDKSQVTVQHSKLDSPEQAEGMKVYWAQALIRLQGLLEGQ
jgi:hypothetical protein